MSLLGSGLAFIGRQKNSSINDVVVPLLERLAVDILDTGVILFDVVGIESISSVWQNHYKSRPVVTNLHISTNGKFDTAIPATMALSENQAINQAIEERAQIFETHSNPPRTQPPSSISGRATTTSRSNTRKWRLVTPICDAIDRAIIIGILVFEGGGIVELKDLESKKLDKVASLIAFQICEVMSIVKRL